MANTEKNYWTQRLLNQLLLICQKMFNLFHYLTFPYKNIEYYRRYLTTYRAINIERCPRTRLYFKVYFSLLFYMSIVNGTLYFLSPKVVSPLLRLVLVDVVHVLQFDRHFHVTFGGIIAYTAVLHWAMYFKRGDGCITVNDIANEVFFGDENKENNRNVQKYVLFEGTFTRTNLKKLVLRITNVLQLFIIFSDIGLFSFCAIVLSSIIKLESKFWIFLFPVLLFHLFLFTLLWSSFLQTQCFFATYGIVSQVYIITVFKLNYVHIKSTLDSYIHSNNNFDKKIFLRHLCSALRRNIHLFQILFISDAFYGQLFFVYLAVNLPTSAYYVAQLTMGLLNNKILFYLVMLLIGETAVGSFMAHLGNRVFVFILQTIISKIMF